MVLGQDSTSSGQHPRPSRRPGRTWDRASWCARRHQAGLRHRPRRL